MTSSSKKVVLDETFLICKIHLHQALLIFDDDNAFRFHDLHNSSPIFLRFEKTHSPLALFSICFGCLNCKRDSDSSPSNAGLHRPSFGRAGFAVYNSAPSIGNPGWWLDLVILEITASVRLYHCVFIIGISLR